MKPFVLYEVGGVQGDIISDDTHTFSVNDDLIDEVEIIQSDNSIEGVKHRLTRAHREKQLKMSCQALHNAPPNRT